MKEDKSAQQNEQSLDELLADALSVSEDLRPGGLWSTDDIDSLLASLEKGEMLSRNLPQRPEPYPSVLPPLQSEVAREAARNAPPLRQSPARFAPPPTGPPARGAAPQARPPAPERRTPQKPLPLNPEANRSAQAGVKSSPAAPNSHTEDIFVILSSERQSIAGQANAAAGRAAAESSVRRERFFRTLETEIPQEEEAPDFRGPIEKPGVLLEKSRFSQTADLQPPPTVVAAELAEEKTRMNAPKARPPEPEPDFELDQIVLTGFHETEEVNRVSEDEVELALHEKRKDKVKSFRLASETVLKQSEEDADLHAVDLSADSEADKDKKEKPERAASQEVEYRSVEQRRRVLAALHTAVKSTNFTIAGLGFLLFLLLGCYLLPLALEWMDAYVPLFLENGVPPLLCLLFLALAALTSTSDLYSGLKALFHWKPTGDSAAGIALLAAFAGNIALFFLPAGAEGNAVFAGAVLCHMLLNTLGKRRIYLRTIGNFEFCAFSHADRLYRIQPFEDERESHEIGRGLGANPKILYSGKIDFPSDFLQQSARNGLTERALRLLLPVSFGAALLMAGIGWGISRDALYAVTAFTGALCLGMPTALFAAGAKTLLRANKKLAETGSVITSFDAAQSFAGTGAAVMESADLFDRSRCDMHGMKDFKNVRVDDVLLYTAALVIQSGGPLIEVFDKVVVGRKELLPNVKNLHYEDKLGLSGWIHGQKVLLGNRNLLANHNIEVPARSTEERYKRDGRHVMYLATAGKIAAMFVVSYKPDESLIPYIKQMEASGLRLLVNTCDPNITEDMIAKNFSLPPGAVRVVSAKAGRLYQQHRDTLQPFGSAQVLHEGGAYTFLKTILFAERLRGSARLSGILQIILTGAALAALLLMVCLSMPFARGDLYLLAFQGINLLLLALAARIKL